ncbi:MAG TPA: thiamine pyrophosphate-dependent enzyme, partial [Dehalococcoidia bacterium]|nr:thiamine pyrophosphate-dependent enzyme [Dehalococcoidia bacterium]
NREIELGIVADCREMLRALNVVAAGRTWETREQWQATVRSAALAGSQPFAEHLIDDDGPVHPYRLAVEVVRAAGPDAIVIADGGETSGWVASAAQVHAPGHFLSHGYLGCLGVGLPFAIAAKVAHPDKPVVCVSGDGSIGLNFSEFDTMVRHGLSIVTVINNDTIWGMSAHGQDILFGRERRAATELGRVRYDEAAAGFGCHAELIEGSAELGPALARAFDAGRPACLNVMTDPNVVSPATAAMYGAARQDDDESEIPVPYYANLEAD